MFRVTRRWKVGQSDRIDHNEEWLSLASEENWQSGLTRKFCDQVSQSAVVWWKIKRDMTNDIWCSPTPEIQTVGLAVNLFNSYI